MHFERKALYNLARMNWLNSPGMQVESWKVDNYREWATEKLFQQLEQLEIPFDEEKFLLYANECETPEEMTECLVRDEGGDPEKEDRIYLLVFELWRRLMPEKTSLSIFCDELDHAISAYDADPSEHSETIQDAIANLQNVLDENADEGGEPEEVFESITSHCANDIESFLCDFIAEQLDDENIIYAEELIEGFSPYLKGSKWFEFLHIRLWSVSDIDRANRELQHFISEYEQELDFVLMLEILHCLAQTGDRKLFILLVKKALAKAEVEEDFQDMLQVCAHYYRGLDMDDKEAAIEHLLESRQQKNIEMQFNIKDGAVQELLQILSS
jgi:hypothetical protein